MSFSFRFLSYHIKLRKFCEGDPELMPSARGRVGESWAGALATATPVWHVRVAGAGVCPLASWVALGISGLGSVVAKWALWMPRRV